jgi:hypothetical protein
VSAHQSINTAPQATSNKTPVAEEILPSIVASVQAPPPTSCIQNPASAGTHKRRFDPPKSVASPPDQGNMKVQVEDEVIEAWTPQESEDLFGYLRPAAASHCSSKDVNNVTG